MKYFSHPAKFIGWAGILSVLGQNYFIPQKQSHQPNGMGYLSFRSLTSNSHFNFESSMSRVANKRGYLGLIPSWTQRFFYLNCQYRIVWPLWKMTSSLNDPENLFVLGNKIVLDKTNKMIYLISLISFLLSKWDMMDFPCLFWEMHRDLKRTHIVWLKFATRPKRSYEHLIFDNSFINLWCFWPTR